MLHQRPSVKTLLRTVREAPAVFGKGIQMLIQGERFDHVGELKLFLKDGRLTEDEKAWREREVIYSGPFTSLLRDSPSLLRAGLRRVLFADQRNLHHGPRAGYLKQLLRQLPTA